MWVVCFVVFIVAFAFCFVVFFIITMYVIFFYYFNDLMLICWPYVDKVPFKVLFNTCDSM